MNRSGLEDAVGAHLPDHFKVAAYNPLIAQDTAHLIVAVDGNAAAVRGFERGWLTGQQSSADYGGRSLCTEEGRGGNEE